MTMFHIFLPVCVFAVVSAQFDPLLNVESCTQDRLVVSTYNAANNGLIYVQGQGESCKQKTTEGVGVYEFDFQQCGIQWEMLFKIVIQKNQGFQTGADKQIPIFCVADRSDLIVTNTKETLDKTDNDGSLNMTVRPTAIMTFYKVVSEEEVMGNEIKLTDTLIMSLQLDSQWTDDFDIQPRYCIASGIVIIQDFCATDPDLFPNFSRLKVGYLISQFGAFRTTSIEGGSVEMNFTCIVQVCMGTCQETNCEGNAEPGRKKRAIASNENNPAQETKMLGNVSKLVITSDKNDQPRHKRQSNGYDIDVGGKINIVEKYSEIQIITSETLCLNAAIFIVVIVFLAAGVVGFGSLSTILYRKLTSAHVTAKNQNLTQQHAVRQHSREEQHVRKFANPFSEVLGDY